MAAGEIAQCRGVPPDALHLKADPVEPDNTLFIISGPAPPAWFAPGQHSDLTVFDVNFGSDHAWRIGYSPSTGKVYIEWMAF
jgi:hypothetical protein